MEFKDKIIQFKTRGKIRSKILTKEAQAIKAIRISKGITREQIACFLNKSGKHTIERFENGRQSLSGETLKNFFTAIESTRNLSSQY